MESSIADTSVTPSRFLREPGLRPQMLHPVPCCAFDLFTSLRASAEHGGGSRTHWSGSLRVLTDLGQKSRCYKPRDRVVTTTLASRTGHRAHQSRAKARNLTGHCRQHNAFTPPGSEDDSTAGAMGSVIESSLRLGWTPGEVHLPFD